MTISLERISLPRGPGSLSELSQSATHVLRIDRSGPALLIDVSGKKPVAHELPMLIIPGKGSEPDTGLPLSSPETAVFSLKGKLVDRIGTPKTFALSPSGERMLFEQQDGEWAVRIGKKFVKFEAGEVSWSDEDTLVASTWGENDTSHLHRVDAKTGKMKKLATIPSVSALAADGNWAVATNVQGKKVLVTWIDLSSGKTQKFELVGSPSGTAVSAGKSGAYVAVNWQKVLHVFSHGGVKKVASLAPAPAEKLPSGHAALIARIEAKAKKAGATLNKGASDKSIAAAEKALGVKFPEEVKAFYRAHDGSEDAGAVEDRELLSLERMVSEWKVWKGLLDQGTFDANDHGEPDPGVQQRWWIPQWIPMTSDGSGNHHVLDLAPAKGGKTGQVLSFWHDDAPRTVEGKDFLTWLAGADWGDPDHVEEADSAAENGEFVRYEMAQKFWAVRFDGSSFTVRFGKQGTAGQEQVKTFSNAVDAQKEHDKLVASKTKKGYRAV